MVYFKDCKKSKLSRPRSCNEVTDAGLANFKDCKDLTYLALTGTKVSDAGLAFQGLQGPDSTSIWPARR